MNRHFVMVKIVHTKFPKCPSWYHLKEVDLLLCAQSLYESPVRHCALDMCGINNLLETESNDNNHAPLLSTSR